MRNKNAQLLLNLGNALEAATDGAKDVQDSVELPCQQVRAWFGVAGIDCGELCRSLIKQVLRDRLPVGYFSVDAVRSMFRSRVTTARA